MNLLIVDDDENGLLVLERSLRHCGFDLDTATNGKIALSKAELQKPDLIISDILMPEMDGFEFCRRIKQDEELKDIPFIFYTATYTEANERKLAMSIGARHFLIKPMPFDELLEIVKQTLEEKQSAPLDQTTTDVDPDSSVERHETILTNKLAKKVKQLELEQQKLLKLNEELEQRVDERTAELKLAKEEAEEANKYKTTFLATMSHELRTPLNSILGFSQILIKQNKLDKEQQRFVTTIFQSSEHLIRLINNVLDISKIEVGQTDVNRNKFNLQLFLHNIIEPFQQQLNNPDLALSLSVDEDMPVYIETDEDKFRQIMLNLIGNAIKFTRQGHIIVDAKVKDNDGTLLSFDIIDTGIGIPFENQQSIFDAFQKSVQPDYDMGGTGLGLAISRKLARLLGGDITLQSEPGKGSNFLLEIQVDIPDNISFADKHSQDEVIGLSPDTKHARILVVDDIANNREVLTRQLEFVGFEVRSVMSGEKALSELETWNADLILLDLNMPTMNGIETMQRIKLNPAHKKTPIIMVSASTMENEHHKCIDAGANDFIDKPINYHELFNLIANLINIEYQYAGNENRFAQKTFKVLTAEELADIEKDWLEKLFKLASIGDTEKMLALISTLPDEKTEIKNKMTVYIQEFKIKSLVRILELGISKAA